MALETATYIDGLVSTNPVSSDNISQGDDHIRLLKSTIKATFPNLTAAVTPTHTELNYVGGVTSAIQTQLNAKAASGSNTDLTSVYLNNTGLKIKDTNASHGLIVAPGSDLTLDRTLTVTTGDSSRTLTISGNATISQDYSASGNPQFATIELGNATDTTISRASGGVIAVEGKPVVTTTGAQTVEFAAGTVLLPSITTTGDTNTGIFFPAADTIALVEGGAEVLRVDATGRVGIGTTSASNLLHVNGAAQATTIEVGHASDTTIARDAAGVISVEGNLVPSPASQANGDILYRGASSWERLAAGTSGQYLKTNGAGAAPSWATVSAGGFTSLGTIATTSGTSQSLSGLTLTGYRFVVLSWVDVSSTSSSGYNVNDGTNSHLIAESGSSAGHSYFGTTWLDLTSGALWSFGMNSVSPNYDTANANVAAGTGGVKMRFGRTRISTSTTSITVTTGAGNFDLGNVYVYGVK